MHKDITIYGKDHLGRHGWPGVLVLTLSAHGCELWFCELVQPVHCALLGDVGGIGTSAEKCNVALASFAATI